MSRPPVECCPRWPVCDRKHEPLAIRIAGRWAKRVAPADRHEGDRGSGHPGSTVRRLHGDAESGQVTPRDSVADRNTYGPEGDARVRGLGRSVESTCGPIERRPGRLVGDRKSQPLAVGITGDRAEVVLLECPDRPVRHPRDSGGGIRGHRGPRDEEHRPDQRRNAQVHADSPVRGKKDGPSVLDSRRRPMRSGCRGSARLARL